MGSPATLLIMRGAHGASGFGVGYLLAEGACPAVNERQLSGGAPRDQRWVRPVGIRVEGDRTTLQAKDRNRRPPRRSSLVASR